MTYDERRQWLLALAPYAVAAKNSWPGMRVSVSLAQAALETGFGKKVIGGHNYWGLKDLKWEPGRVPVYTHEWDAANGRLQPIVDYFEDFDTVEAGFACYGRLVTNSPTYREARENETLDGYIDALAERWATDPRYNEKIKKIIKDYELSALDAPAA